jgi:hypothetical protein
MSKMPNAPAVLVGLSLAGALGAGLWFFTSFAVGEARYSARRLTGISHGKILALSLHNYASSNSGRLPSDEADNAPRSWRTKILQFLDRADLQKRYRDDVAWDAEPNAALAQEYVVGWQISNNHPVKRDAHGRHLTDFGFLSGPGTVNPPDGMVALDDISQRDGLGQTIMLGECSGLRIVWTEPRDPDVSREEMGIEVLTKPEQTSRKLLSGYTRDGVVAAFADGAVRIVSKKIDPRVLKALTTIDGGEPISQADYLP